MGEGFDLSALLGMFGGGGGVDTSNFGASLGQPQAQGIFGGTPQTAGGNFMAGTMPSTPTMANFDAGTLPQGSQPLSFGMGSGSAAYGQGSMPNLGALAGMGGMKQPQHQAMAPQMPGGGGGGGNMKGLFSSLMRNPNLRQVNPTLGLLGNALGQ